MIVDVIGRLDAVVIGATGLTEIMQNVQTICATVIGSVPLVRDFGIDGSFIDLPLPLAQARMAAAIVTAVQRWEPRVEVSRIIWDDNTALASDGRLMPTVRIKIREGAL